MTFQDTSAGAQRSAAPVKPKAALSDPSSGDEMSAAKLVLKKPQPTNPLKFVDQQGPLDALVAKLEVSPGFAIDAEMDSYYCYYTKLCLIQISTLEEDFLIDPLVALDFSGLGHVFANPKVIKFAHAAENDIPYFRKVTGCEFAGLFDTHLAAKTLEYPRSGLAALLEEFQGISIDKQYQTADWRLRPLPPEMAEYARNDTCHLIVLADQLKQILEEQQKAQIAEFRFRQACQVVLQEKRFNAWGWQKISGATKLPPAAQSVLHSLYSWREFKARELDLSLFRVLPDGMMCSLASHALKAEGNPIQRYSHPHLRAYETEILSSIREGLANPKQAAAEPAKPKSVMSRQQEKQFKTIRDWRNESQLQILTNRSITELVTCAPNNWDSFIALELLPTELYEGPGKELWTVYRELLK
jgi:ribonuclease D